MKSNRFARTILGLAALAGATAGWAAPALAADVDDAADAALASGGCDEGKLATIRKEYDATKKVTLLRDMADCYAAMGQDSSAITYYDQYLRAAKGAPDASAVSGKIDALKAKKAAADSSAGRGFLDIKVNVDGAEIKIDGEKKGTSPMTKKLSLTAGLYEVGVTAGGYPDWLGTANVTEGETTDLKVEMEKPGGGVPVLAIVGAAAGVAAIAIAVIVIVAASKKLPEPTLSTEMF